MPDFETDDNALFDADMEVESIAEVGENGELPVGKAERKLADYLRTGHDWARMVCGPTKSKWSQYLLQKHGRGIVDDPNDPLQAMGIYIPAIARFIDILIYNAATEMIPDPSAMDFFTLRERLPWIREYADKITSIIRQKFRQMRPRDCDDFFSAIVMLLDDRFTYGNQFSIMTHESFQPAYDAGTVIDGATLQYLDPFNVWPWQVDVNSSKQTNWSIYNPIDRAELEGGGYVNLGLVRRNTERVPMRDPDAVTDIDGSQIQLNRELYRMYTFIGRFPATQLAEELGVDEGAVYDELAAKFGFDREGAEDSEWWYICWIGDNIVKCMPYPLMLPYGECPIMHDVHYKRNGYLFGHGLYDRVGWDERLLNYYNRQVIRLGKVAAQPPFLFYRGVIDPEWYNNEGGKPQIKPNTGIPVANLTYQGDPIRPLRYNVESIPLLESQTARHDGVMREITSVTSALEGNDNARSATQAQNNMQQSRMSLNFMLKKIEQGFLRDVVARVYVITQQAMNMSGVGEVAWADGDVEALNGVVVKPEDLVSIDLLVIEMLGSSSPTNRMMQSEAFARFLSVFMPLGIIKPLEAAMLYAKFLNLSGINSIFATGDPMVAMMTAQQIAQTFGPAAIAQLMPAEQRAQLLAMQAMGGREEGFNPRALAQPQPMGAGQQARDSVSSGTQRDGSSPFQTFDNRSGSMGA